MTVRSKHLKLVGAMGAAALTIGAMASPALAATQEITYNCTKGNPAPLGPIDTTVDAGNIPAKLVAGQKKKTNVTVVVHLNPTQTGLAQSLGTSVKGSISSKGVDALDLKIPATPIPPPPATTMDVTASGTGTVSSGKAGTVKVTSGTIGAVLKISNGAGSLNASSSCKMPTDGSQVLGTVKVSKDRSKTATTATYSAKKDVAKGTAKVKGAKFGLAGTGKVKFTLKKGTHKIKTMTGKLNKRGIASVKFKNVKKKGKYSITAKFGGDKGLKGSSGKDTFKV